MSRIDQLSLEVRGLEASNAALERRVARLEAARRTKRTAPPTINGCKRGYVNISVAELDRRWNLRREYEDLKFLETCNRVYSRRKGDHVPTSLPYFQETVRDANGNKLPLRELQRYYALTSTIAPGSPQDIRFTRTYRAEISRMRSAGFYIGMPLSEAAAIHAPVN